MALLHPVYAVIVPFLFVVTVPLAIFAGITTTLAFAVLLLRVTVIYLDIALSLVPKSLAGFSPYARYRHPPPPTAARALNRSPSPVLTPQLRRRRRRPSSASLMSFESVVTASGDAASSSLGLIPSVGAERDFEGVGGWRTGDDESWTAFNSRLEMPDRHHHRAASGGPATPGEGSYLMMKGLTRNPEASIIKPSTSPNSSRARTPSGPRVAFGGTGYSDGYFPMTQSPKASKKPTAHPVA